MLRTLLLLPAQVDVDVDSLEDALGDEELTAWTWGRSVLVLVVAFVISRVLKALVTRVMKGRSDPVVADLVGRLVGYVVMTFGLIYALDSLGVRIAPLLGALGIIGIALAFALKDILENFVAGLMLQVRRPFSYGDEVASGEIEGRIDAIDARSVTVVTPDGETVYLPSSQVITQAIVNHTQRGARRTTIPFGVAYGSDLPMVQRVFLDAVRNSDGVLDEPEPEILLEGFGDSSVDFAVRYWHRPTIAELWRTQSIVALALAAACRDNDIEIPFPQQVVRIRGFDPGLAGKGQQEPPQERDS